MVVGSIPTRPTRDGGQAIFIKDFYLAHLRSTPVGALWRSTKAIRARFSYALDWLSALRVRAGYVRRALWPKQKLALAWLWRSRERSNFTYDITPRNRLHATHLLSVALGEDLASLEGYIAEIDADDDLRNSVTASARSLPATMFSDSTCLFGRRVVWYAAVRAMKPRTVVETGVEKGLGAVAICAALRRNAAEGRPGRYFGLDLLPWAGVFLVKPYADFGEMLYGDSLETLRIVPGPIDLLINDSDHSARHERAEYELIASKLSARAIIIGDNAHHTDELANFSAAHGRRFLFLREDAVSWYPGAGIGISFPGTAKS